MAFCSVLSFFLLFMNYEVFAGAPSDRHDICGLISPADNSELGSLETVIVLDSYHYFTLLSRYYSSLPIWKQSSLDGNGLGVS